MTAIPSGGLAVMQNRRDPIDSLDFFPTPPWATRALCEIVLPRLGVSLAGKVVWDPAAGEGHMAKVLAEYAGLVVHSDVHDYGIGSQIGSFVGAGPDVIGSHCEAVAADAVIFNPPFNLAVEFVLRALKEAHVVAVLVRTSWLEGGERFRVIFEPKPPSMIAQFSERVPMVKGRWDPEATTATSYAWIVWGDLMQTRFMWIPPGQRKALTRDDDVARFANRPSTAPAPEGKTDE